MRRYSLFLILAFYLYSPSISAQEKLEGQPLQFRAWSGYSFSSVYLLGKTRNANSFITGIGARKAIRKYDNNALLYYTGDIIPYIYYHYPKRDDNDRMTKTSGFGISPFGLLYDKPINDLWNYQLSISGSFILLNDIFPTDESRKLNFTFDPSFSIKRKITESFNLVGGYKFHHISNAQTGNENPGLDSNFIYLSLIFK